MVLPASKMNTKTDQQGFLLIGKKMKEAGLGIISGQLAYP